MSDPRKRIDGDPERDGDDMFEHYDATLTPGEGPYPHDDIEHFSGIVGHDVLVQAWEPTTGSWRFIYRGNLDDAADLPDGTYQGTSHRFIGTVIVRGGIVVSVGS